MIFYVLTSLIAIIGLGFLIFIHELGHYFVARRVGMTVEVFSIGFGRPIYVWNFQGVKWQIGWIPFGGYVKILGMELKEDQDPYKIPGSFFSKSPWARIKVSLAGPLVNLLFALLVFIGIWCLGGREKNFSELTPKIGWVDRHSELYEKGVRPGDEIIAYNQEPYHGIKDNMYAPMTSGGEIAVEVKHTDYFTGATKKEKFEVKTYSHPNAQDRSLVTSGILDPASFVICALDGELHEIKGSPMIESGIKPGDRIVWIDGELIFSPEQMSRILNENQVLLTIQSKGKTYLRRVPRVLIEELKLDNTIREEFVDWQHEANILESKINKLYVIPYDLDHDNVVREPLRFIDADDRKQVFPDHLYSSLNTPLETGDKIVAIAGEPVTEAFKLFELLQRKKVRIIVARDSLTKKTLSFNEAEAEFISGMHLQDLDKIIATIGSEKPITNEGSLHVLQPVTPKKITDFELTAEERTKHAENIAHQRRHIEETADPDRVHELLKRLDQKQNLLKLGLPIQDERVVYNIQPLEQFKDVFREVAHTLVALFSGYLNPKWISGPVGIVQVVQQSSTSSLNEMLYWLGVISLNLGMLNLLPIPVLDGGYIVLFLYEAISRRRLHPKTLEKLIIPFVILLVGFIIYVTFHDVERIFRMISG